MTKDDIAKLPTPVYDALIVEAQAHPLDWSSLKVWNALQLTEQRLAAAVMALEELSGAEWMVTHDWGGDRESMLNGVSETLAAIKGHAKAA